MITFHTEDWATYFRDCQTLWVEHYEEVAVAKDRMAMKPNVPVYEALERAGELDILVARSEGRMVGYILSVIRPHLHYADVLCGFEDAYFLSRPHRKGLAGVRLFQAWEKRMRARGCQKWFLMTKPFLDMGPILKRLGYGLSDYVYAKSVEG